MNTIIRNIYKCLGLGLVVAFSVVAQGCSNDDGLTDGTAASRHAVFVVNGVDAKTRVAYSNYISSEFEVGDELGACVVLRTGEDNGKPSYGFMDGFENVRYKVVVADYTHTYTDNGNNVSITYTRALAPVIPTDVFPTEKRYVFYYPYKAGADVTNFNHTVLADQSIKEAFETSDLLRARVNGTDEGTSNTVLQKDDKGNQYLDVSMEHVMASIVLKVEPGLIKEDSKATLCNVCHSVSGIDLTRALSSEEQVDAEYPAIPGETTLVGDITMLKDSYTKDGYTIYRAVIPGQKVEANTEFFRLTFSDGNEKTFNLNVAGNADVSFKPNNYYLFTLTKNDGLRFRGIIEDLKNGGDYFYEY